MGFLETPTTVSSITMKVIWVFAEDHDDQNGPCLESVACTIDNKYYVTGYVVFIIYACTNPELRKQTFATSERE